MAYTNIDDPSAHFQVSAYSNNGSTITVTNDGNSDLKPDLIWNKQRTNAGYHGLWDSSRGISRSLSSNISGSEQLSSGKGITAFNTDGFTGVTGSWAEFNQSSQTSVAWQWKANGGTTSTNNDGNHTSVVQANQDAGFSIVTYTGTGNTSSTVGHGLGVTPNWVIFKRRDGTGNWDVQIDGTSRATLNLTEAAATNVLSSFSSTTFGLGSATSNEKNANGSTYVAYAFAEKQGYSKFGKYVGNGDANGPFVYTGFKPAFVLFKKSSDSGDNWMMYDNKRSDSNGNVVDRALHPNSSAAEYDNANANLDILSNGFKLRSSFGWVNQNTHTYIYMAFAENPFVTSTGIPTTAR